MGEGVVPFLYQGIRFQQLARTRLRPTAAAALGWIPPEMHTWPGGPKPRTFPWRPIRVRQAHAFIVKLNPQGSALVYSTQLGGGQYDRATGIALNAAGAHVVGVTASPDCPFTGSFAAGHALPDGTPNTETFVAQLDPSGKIVYAVQLGGSSGSLAIAIDGSGNTYVLGATNDQDFPVTAGAIDACNSFVTLFENEFLVKLTADGTTLLYSTFLPTSANAMALDSLGNIWLVGGIFDTALPSQAATSVASQTPIDAFVSKLDLSAPFQFGITCVANATMFVQGAIAPGEIISIFGAGLGPELGVGLQRDSQGRIAAEAGGTSVLIGGVPALILYAQANQVNTVVPYEIAGTTSTTLQVGYQGRRTPAMSLSVAPSAPAILTINGSGAGQAAILNQDGTVNSAANPAAKGSIIALFATGDGVESPAQPDGALTAVLQQEAVGSLGAPHLPHHVVAGIFVLEGHIPGLNHGVELRWHRHGGDVEHLSIGQAHWHRGQLQVGRPPIAPPPPL